MLANNQNIDISTAERLLKNTTSEDFIKKGDKRAIELFHLMSKRVPAYKDFLVKNKINPDKIKSISDFQEIPPIDKDNYLRYYPLELLCWDGEFKSKKWVISTTSGSTGNPFYFPRTGYQDDMYSFAAELYLRNNFQIQNKSTLYINGFAMGAWIGGVFTYEAIKTLMERGNYHMSIITPGIFKEEIIKAVINLGDKYDQILIGGYPPFIKDMVDDAILKNVEWEKYNVGFIFSAEAFTETFRDYINEKCKLTNVFTSTLNHYGSVDLGTMAHETPISIFLRRLLIKNPQVYRSFFDNPHRLPTLAQYNPEQFYFEENEGQLFCSSFSGLPLVRYDLKDKGGIYTFKEVKVKLNKSGLDLSKEIDGINLGASIWNLPFVYVYERSDFIVKLYGANIYPETIRKSLQEAELSQLLTGKFTMQIIFDEHHNQFLEINIELKKNVSSSFELEKDIQRIIVAKLLRENSEYKSNYTHTRTRQIPKIVLWPYEDKTYFSPGVKQKWVKFNK